ncbi:nicotinate-nucleotide--dimethylbenzimidazole phosphoribosyltransferase [Streptomyces sp. NPDC013953]|uniref:nicotinate-nucleotide--dimethylbenzimidazole phosphoribosyltransferase n=1 Tax=Streptomyces sp. NPDC013953 TaxID=3364868 RepID=UPI0036FCD807
MTDTGQVPGGQPENAGMVEQPGIPAPGAYTFLDPSESAAEDDDLLLMPGAQGAWGGDPQAAAVAPPVHPMPVHQVPASAPAAQHAVPAPAPAESPAPAEAPAPLAEDAPAAPAPAPGFTVPEQPQPVYETYEAYAPAGYEQVAPEADAHVAGGRDSGSVDLSAVRMPPHAPAPAEAPAPAPVAAPAAQGAQPARRPLHMGPPVPEAPSGVVRSLADRGPAAAPVHHPGPAMTGPEYLDVPREEPAPGLAGAQSAEIPPQGAEPWPAQPAQPAHEPQEPQAPAPAAAETVVPEPPAAQFVPVEGSVPTTPHLAPTPAAEPAPQPTVPAPREGDAHPVAAHVAETPQEPAAAVPEEPQAAAPVEPAPVAEQPEPAPAAPAAPEPPAAEAPVADAPVTPEAPAVEAPVAPEAPAPEAPLAADAPVAEAPAPQAPVAEAPAAEAPVAEAPAAEAPVAPEAPAPDAPVAEDPAPQAPVAGPPVAEVPAGEAPVAGEAEADLPQEAPQVQEPQESPEAARPEEQPAAPATADDGATADPTTGIADVDSNGDSDGNATDATTDPAAGTSEAAPPAPGYDDAEREAVLRVMRERRDIRNGFRSDPIPHEVLLRVLEAAHTAPSVGHSQPWDFVVIRSAETRRTMHELAQRQREAYAKSLPKGRAKQFKELKIEAILETPVNIVVTADPTRGGRHTLGRHTQPQMAPYSSALAVENLWLAARAEGLGVGWVSFFDEREMVRALGLPEHLEVVAYLCVGYVDEFPDEPELMQAGWSKRRPLSWVVHEETYGRRALPGEEPHDLLQETVSNIRPLDAKALGEAWERQKRMTKPAGALGMLEIISAQLSGLSRMCPPPIPEPAAVAIFAGDHGVHAQGVTAWPQEVTAQMVANFLGGGAVCNAFANQVGAEVCVIDVGVAGDLPATPGLLPRKVRPGTADFTTGPALTREEVLAAVEVGIETARDLVAAGNKALLTGEMGIANTTASAALISVYTDVDPAEVTGRGTGINDEMHARKVDVVRRALALHQPDPADPLGVLAAVGGLEHAALVGFILGGASLRTPVVLDGVSAGAAALVARAIAPESLAACIAGHRSAEPGHVAALNKLGLRPLVDLDLRLGEGTGALLALPIVQSAARAMHEVATFDSAGVTEK